MLKISLHQFRCWENLTINAPLGQITLIRGQSGVGKTTLLQAIAWCLYGNIRLVAPNHLEKAKTKVNIEVPYTLNNIPGILTIERQKNPNRLLLTHMQNSYEDKVAQSIIDDIFGNYDIWLTSCYIGQGCRNNFLTAPNTGKMELLNNIAFHEEDPTTYIEKIDSTITETDTLYQQKLAAFTAQLNTLQSFLLTIDTKKALTPSQVSEIQSAIEFCINEETRLKIIHDQRNINIGILNNLKSQYDRAMSVNILVPAPDTTLLNLNTKFQGEPLESIDTIENIINKITGIIPLLQRRDDLDLEIRRLDSMLLPYTNYDRSIKYTMNDYQDAVSKETVFRDNQRLAQSLNVLYSESVIQETIKRYQNLLASQQRIKLEHEQQTLQNQLQVLERSQQLPPIVFPEINSQSIAVPDYSKYVTTGLSNEISELSQKQGSLQSHIQHLLKSQDVIQCPQCKSGLRYNNGNLSLADTGPINKAEITNAQQELMAINQKISKLNYDIQQLIQNENVERSAYERALMMEQKRIDTLKEKVKQLELEQQRRDIAEQNRLQQVKEMKDKIQELDNTIDTYPEIIGERKLLTMQEIQSINGIIGKLSNIIIAVPPTISSQQIQSYLTFQDLLQKTQSAISAKEEYVLTIPDIFRNESIQNLQLYIDKLRQYRNDIRDKSEEKSRNERLKISLQEQMMSINNKLGSDVTNDINELRTRVNNLRQDLITSESAHKVLKLHEQVTREREEVIAMNSTLADLQTLRHCAVETECKILQQVVDTINMSIQSVCESLFDKDININLNLFKTMKTSKHVKPVVNFTVSYQGGTFDNINQMSGGEGDRASLALTLALNKLSSCPFMMLDESLASLDVNMKEAAIRTIRENTNNTILIIMHDGVEGIFDTIINLDETSGSRY